MRDQLRGGVVGCAKHGDSELLDDIVASKPKLEHTRYHSPGELKEHGLAQLHDEVTLAGTRPPPGAG